MSKVVVNGFDSFKSVDKESLKEIEQIESIPEEDIRVIEDVQFEEETDNSDEIFKVKEEDLSKHVVKSIGSIFSLESIIVSVLTEENKTIGIPGFFNSETKKFILLDGSNVPCENFDEQFLKYLNSFSEKGGKKNEQSPES
ncbi:MAG TPA: hypothetical protein VMZ91_04945 [Candidatus Paceibacterota bacterium]|nr:hypothetical protein [Candidatus Paceibacterota bacterium]